jgi:hypothetical protein
MSARLDRLKERVVDVLRPTEGADTAIWTGVFVFVLAVVIAGVLVTFGGGTGRDPDAVTTSSGAPTDPLDAQGAWNPYVAVVGGGRGGSETAEQQWGPVVRGFVKDFLGAHDDPRWLTKITPLVSPQLRTRLGWVVRGQVPTGTLTGLTLQTAGDHVADVTATYTSNGVKHGLGVMVVDLPKDGRGWMVYGYENRAV